MTPYYERDGIVIYCGDCLEVMPGLEPGSVDSIVTDPPYGLEFMGKDWDHGIPGIPFWQAALTVAKPGAMLLAFGGTRTYHRLTCAIEDAGWEVRDCVMWLYGSGFPKSHDISKAIDKAAGAERQTVGFGDVRRASQSQPFGQGAIQDVSIDTRTITAPATPAAAEWAGWGTALKPAHEPITLAMAPMPGTFAANALEYGCAGLWIDGARVEATDNVTRERDTNGGVSIFGTGKGGGAVVPIAQGRWPANVIHDGSEEVLAGFPVSVGKGRGYSPANTERTAANGQIYGFAKYADMHKSGAHFGDSGSAARFFYTAKASKAERGEDNDHPTVKPLALLRHLCRLTKTPTGGVILDLFMGSGSLLKAAMAEGRQAIGIDKDEASCQIAVERLQIRRIFSIPQRNGTIQAKQEALWPTL